MQTERAMEGLSAATDWPVLLPAVSLVLPAFNEEPAIRQAIREAATALGDLRVEHEVIVVDDGSTDGTARAALEEASLHANVRVISLPQNAGYTAALQAGFRAAQHSRVAFTDADCQFDLHDLGRLLPLARDFDIVCGYRINRKDVWRRRFLSGGFNLLARALLGTAVRDCDCALKILPRDWVNSLQFEGGGFFFNAELLANARLQGLRITETGVTHWPRVAGSSKVSLGLVLPVLVALLRFWWTRVMFPATDQGSSSESTSPRSDWGRTVLGSLALIAIGSAVLLPWSSFPLMAPDETRYAEIAREMLDSGDLVIPTRIGLPYLEKPPLLYWLTAGSYRLFGVSVTSARLVPIGAALLTVLLTFWLGTPILGRRAAWLGAVLLLTCAGFLLSGRFLYMDSLLTLWTTVTFLAAYVAIRGELLHRRYWILAAVACGLGILTKGPVAVALCFPPLVVSRWLNSGTASRGCRIGWRDWISFAAVAGVVSLPWFVLVSLRQGAFAGDFLLTHHLSRFVGGLSHREPCWYFVPVLLICTLPCSILYPAVAGFLLTRDPGSRAARSRGLGFLLVSAVWIFSIFSASSCKLPPYILPAVPLICLATGTALNSIMLRKPATRFLGYIHDASPRDLTGMLAWLCLVATGVDLWLLDDPFHSRVIVWAIGTGLGIGLLTMLLVRRAASGTLRWGAAIAYCVLVMGHGVGTYHTAVASRMTVGEPIASIRRTLPVPPSTIVCYSISRVEDGIAFHSPEQQTRGFELHEDEAAVAALQAQPGTLLVTEVDDLPRITQILPDRFKLSELGRTRHYVVLSCQPQTGPRGAVVSAH